MLIWAHSLKLGLRPPSPSFYRRQLGIYGYSLLSATSLTGGPRLESALFAHLNFHAGWLASLKSAIRTNYHKQEVAGSFPKRYMAKPLFFTIIWTEWNIENSDYQSELGI